jgi:EF hand domain-containing protein
MLRGLMTDWRWLILFGLLLVGCGCSSVTMELPKWDPATATDRALSEHDSNHDGKLSREELKKCPGLSSAIADFDQDGDGSISGDELKSVLQGMKDDEAALVEVACVVTHNNKPLEGATVKFVPESFLGEAFEPATGVTARNGTAYPSVAEEKLPEEYRGRIQGVHVGVYRVEVTHPNVAVPAKFNTQSGVGQFVNRRTRDALTINF